MNYPTDRTGKRYGRLIAVSSLHPNRFGSLWICQCDCGNQITVSLSALSNGRLKSCGCAPKGRPKLNHNMSKSRVYRIWKMMHQRCNNPKAEGYQNYGGRGIRVCDAWCSFEQFLSDMGEPTLSQTLDRKENNKGYSRSNCKWSTYKEQHQNRRDNHNLAAFGKIQCLTAWAEEYGLPVSTLKNRLYRANMKPEDALRAPLYAKQRGTTA